MKNSKRRSRRRSRRLAERNSWTISPDHIEQAILQKAGAHANAIQRVVLAGMKLLFSKETHDKLFNNIRTDVPLDQSLGSSAVHIMTLLAQNSKNMPGEAFIPAGTILLARTCEFIHKTNMFKMTDDVFYGALDMFIAVVHREVKKGEYQRGKTPDQAPQPTSDQPQAPDQPADGMLNGGAK